MNQYFLNIVAFLLFIELAQAQISLIGVIKDSSNLVIEYATVFATNLDNDKYEGGKTDEEGFFHLFVDSGQYILTVRYLGYEVWEKEMVIEQSVNIGDIILKQGNNTLETIQITGKKPLIEQRVDRLIFNV